MKPFEAGSILAETRQIVPRVAALVFIMVCGVGERKQGSYGLHIKSKTFICHATTRRLDIGPFWDTTVKPLMALCVGRWNHCKQWWQVLIHQLAEVRCLFLCFCSCIDHRSNGINHQIFKTLSIVHQICSTLWMMLGLRVRVYAEHAFE